jgi:hypothetical protein
LDRSLWLLLGLRLWGWLRRLGRMMKTVRGALLMVIGTAVVALWLLSVLWQSPSRTPEHLADVRRYGPLVFVAFFLLNLLFSTGERAITFTPAEVNYLFPGPFTRRQLLAYKITGTAGASLLSALFMALFLRPHLGSLVAGVVGLTLSLVFMQLLSMLLALLASTVGARAYNRRRKLVLGFLAVVLAVALYQVGLDQFRGDWHEALRRVEESPVIQWLLTPLTWFVQAATAERIWPSLIQWSALALLVILIMLALVFALDAQYLEASAAASEKLYARLQQVRRGGPAAVRLPSSGKARWGMPPLPCWGGVGPLAWRQLTTALRGLWSLVILVIVFGAMMAPALAQMGRPGSDHASVAVLAGFLPAMTIFVAALLPFDFRGDLDRMDVLKALPLPAWRVVVGQLLAPVLLLVLCQLLVVAVVQMIVGQVENILLITAAFLGPVNVLLFGIENLFFLWFPTRAVAATPGDFQALGRHILLWLCKAGTLLLALAVATLAAVAAYFAAGGSWIAALTIAWLVVSGVAVGLIPLIALAFQHFDVAADVPP